VGGGGGTKIQGGVHCLYGHQKGGSENKKPERKGQREATALKKTRKTGGGGVSQRNITPTSERESTERESPDEPERTKTMFLAGSWRIFKTLFRHGGNKVKVRRHTRKMLAILTGQRANQPRLGEKIRDKKKNTQPKNIMFGPLKSALLREETQN